MKLLSASNWTPDTTSPEIECVANAKGLAEKTTQKSTHHEHLRFVPLWIICVCCSVVVIVL